MVFLVNKGYRILERNYRTKFGEIDIICKDPGETLVFIEVKTLIDSQVKKGDFLPEDNLSSWKLYKLQRICQFFANQHPKLIEENGWQIDLVAILIGSKSCKVRHYQNIY